jgi:hypothetical protein
MKGKLEKLVNFGKKVGKKTIAAAVVIPLIFSAPVRALNIYMWNNSTGISTNSFVNSYNDDANEGADPKDGHYAPVPNTPRLEITSNEPGFRAEWNNKPKNTPYSEMEFSVKGSITGPVSNSVTFYVEDPDGELEHRALIAYNVSNPNDVYYPVKNNGAMTIFPLPSLQNRQDEVYATWHIATPPLVLGDIASPGAGSVGKLDGKVDIYDLKVIADSWLYETFEGENYS